MHLLAEKIALEARSKGVFEAVLTKLETKLSYWKNDTKLLKETR